MDKSSELNMIICDDCRLDSHLLSTGGVEATNVNLMSNTAARGRLLSTNVG